MAFRIWFALSFLFLIYNLVLLVNDSYSISYLIVEKDNRMYDNHTNYLICTSFKDINFNDKLKIKPEIQNVSIEIFLNYSISSIELRLNTTNLFQLNQSSLFLERFCFLTNKEELEKKIPLNNFLKYYRSALFTYSNGKQPAFYELIYFKGVHESNAFYLKTYKQKVYDKQYLKSSSKCFTYQDQLASNRYHCLNKCFVNFKIKESFYNFYDNETFDLNLIMSENKNQLIQQTNNDEIKRKNILKSCLAECPGNDCF